MHSGECLIVINWITKDCLPALQNKLDWETEHVCLVCSKTVVDCRSDSKFVECLERSEEEQRCQKWTTVVAPRRGEPAMGSLLICRDKSVGHFGRVRESGHHNLPAFSFATWGRVQCTGSLPTTPIFFHSTKWKSDNGCNCPPQTWKNPGFSYWSMSFPQTFLPQKNAQGCRTNAALNAMEKQFSCVNPRRYCFQEDCTVWNSVTT